MNETFGPAHRLFVTMRETAMTGLETVTTTAMEMSASARLLVQLARAMAKVHRRRIRPRRAGQLHRV